MASPRPGVRLATTAAHLWGSRPCSAVADAAAVAAEFATHGKKIVCVGKNYRAHITELSAGKNALWKDDAASAAEPVLFMKPTTCYVLSGGEIVIPHGIGEVQHELELAVVIGRRCKDISEAEALGKVAGYAISLDLTARDIQVQAKQEGTPWLVSKGYVSGTAALHRDTHYRWWICTSLCQQFV